MVFFAVILEVIMLEDFQTYYKNLVKGAAILLQKSCLIGSSEGFFVVGWLGFFLCLVVLMWCRVFFFVVI